MSSTSDLARGVVLLACVALGGACSSPRPNEVGVDDERLAIDLDACIAGDASCMLDCDTKNCPDPNGKCDDPKACKPVAIESLLPGTRALLLFPNSTIDAPLIVPSSNAKLAYLVFAMQALGNTDLPHGLEVTITASTDGGPPTQITRPISPIGGYTRTEVDFQQVSNVQPTIHLEVREGDGVQLLWVVGRWND